MFASAGTIRMTVTGGSCHDSNAGKLLTAVPASVFGFFGTFIEFVLTSAGTVRMAWT